MKRNYKILIKPSCSNPNKTASKWDFGDYDFIITYKKDSKLFFLYRKNKITGYLKAMKLAQLKLNKICNQRKIQ